MDNEELFTKKLSTAYVADTYLTSSKKPWNFRGLLTSIPLANQYVADTKVSQKDVDSIDKLIKKTNSKLAKFNISSEQVYVSALAYAKSIKKLPKESNVHFYTRLLKNAVLDGIYDKK